MVLLDLIAAGVLSFDCVCVEENKNFRNVVNLYRVFCEDLFPQKKAQREGIRKDLCPQITQMHADGGEGEF
jgi:hypothetical protein